MPYFHMVKLLDLLNPSDQFSHKYALIQYNNPLVYIISQKASWCPLDALQRSEE